MLPNPEMKNQWTELTQQKQINCPQHSEPVYKLDKPVECLKNRKQKLEIKISSAMHGRLQSSTEGKENI